MAKFYFYSHFLIIFLFLFSCFLAQSHFKPLKHNDKGLKKVQIKDVKNAFICQKTICELVEEFKISYNETPNCYDQNLPIDFMITIDSVKQETFGYLQQKIPLISKHQSTTNYCQHIKRFCLKFQWKQKIIFLFI